VSASHHLLGQLRLPSATIGPDIRVRWVSADLDSVWPRHPFVVGQVLGDLGSDFADLTQRVRACLATGQPSEVFVGERCVRVVRAPDEEEVVLLVQGSSGASYWFTQALDAAPFGIMVSNLHDEPLASNAWVRGLVVDGSSGATRALGRRLTGSNETAMLARGDDSSRLESVGQGEARRWVRIRSWLLRNEQDQEPAAVARVLNDETLDVAQARQKEHLGALARLGEMAAVVAHEVRNPLAGVTGALRILSSRFAEDSSEHRIVREMLERLKTLDNTVEELVLFARPIHPRPERANLMEVLEHAARDVNARADLSEVRVEIEGPPLTVTGDAELLRHCFRNLLTNAAQSMHGGGQVQVRILPSEDLLEVEVTDEGPGVPLQMEQKVFEPFFTTRSRGTGLGLPVAQRIAQSHGGNVEYRPQPGRGATFVVSLAPHPTLPG
jgi:signal transduction histidine kinase